MVTTQEFPRRYWASEEGLVALKRLGEVPFEIEQVRDRMLIAEAFNRFAIAHDENRLDVVLSVMADDVDFAGSLGTATPFNGYRGKKALEKGLLTGIPKMPGQRRHAISNVVVESMDERTATAYAYGVVTNAVRGLLLQASVIYVGDLRKEDDGFWRFTRFFIGMDEYDDENEPTLPRAGRA